MNEQLKALVFKLDREIWACVETGDGTVSWARQESAKLIQEYSDQQNKELSVCACKVSDTPCSPNCTCKNSVMSGGCLNCATYGNEEQRKNMAEDIQQRLSEIQRLTKEVEELKSVMIAAAEEIQAHWNAHCDEEGYGPTNLMHRLEKGIPSQYGYTAGAFMKQQELINGQRERLTRLRELLGRIKKVAGNDLNRYYAGLSKDIDNELNPKP